MLFYYRSKRTVSNALDQLSTKDIHHLIQLLDSIQRHEKSLEDISEEDETRLNYLMDHFGIGHIRERRSVTSKNSVLGEESQDKDFDLKTSIATLYRLIYLLDSLQTGEMSIDEITGEDRDVFNYFMDLEGI